jgi:CBS domain-containing protein
MICPVCGHHNMQGADECQNCGSDLRTVDIPQPSNSFEQRLVTEPLSSLAPQAAVTVGPTIGAADAIRRMQDGAAGVLVVEDDTGVVGIFTERDALLKLAGRSLDGLTIEQLMTRDPVMLRHDDTIAVAIHKMAVGGFRHIPLVENGRATGMVSAGDLFRYILDIID